jgi:hypothetical protein
MDEIEKDLLHVLPALIVKRGIKALLVPRFQGVKLIIKNHAFHQNLRTSK